MIRKSSLFTLLFCFSTLSQQAYAQLEIGISGGYNKNKLHTSTGYRTSTRYEGVSGFEVGIPIQYHFNDWLGIQAELSYIQKNYKLSRTNFYSGIYQKNTNSYMQVPLMAHISFGGKQLKGFLNLGGYGAYWAASRIKGVLPNVFTSTDNMNEPPKDQYIDMLQPYYYNEKYVFDSRRDLRIELGLLAGIGLAYSFPNKYKIFAEGRYYYGLSDLQKDYMINQIPRYNDTYAIRIGCLVNIKNIL